MIAAAVRRTGRCGFLGLCAVLSCREHRGTGAQTTAASASDPQASSAPPTEAEPLSDAAARGYDLTVDVATRRAEVRARFGDQAAVQVEDGVFLFAASRDDATFEAAVKLARQALAAYFNGRFSRHPDRAVTVYLFGTQAAFDAFYKRWFGEPVTSDLGFYDRASRDVLVNAAPGLPTLTHELVHPIVQSDFPDAPAWINEGLGALFEKPVFPRPGEVHGETNWRLPRLRVALSSQSERAKTRLDALFAMRDEVFHGPQRDLHYAMARYVCQWLDARGQLWAFYGAWRDGVIEDRGGERAFARVVGMTPADANEPWVAWVKGL